MNQIDTLQSMIDSAKRIVFFGGAGVSKESGIPVKLALEKLQSNPKFTVMIGDAPMDYLAAKNGGVARTILAATGQIDEETLLQTSQYTVSSLDEISIC